MPHQPTRALSYAQEQKARFLNELIDFVSIPSISTDPSHRADMLRAAEWVAARLKHLDMQPVQVIPTAGHPLVYGQWLIAGPDAPTVLVYGHYDVQPAEPLELWQSDPFQPSQRGENLYGRGVTDMKGQVMVVLNALEAVLRSGCLGVNLKVLIEGEEEIGSTHIKEFIASHPELLRADFALNTDTGLLVPDLPTITYALRGLAYFEIRVSGPANDLHSGIFGGAIHNPAQALCEIIAGMHDADGRVTLPGFYETVRPLSAEERAELSRLPTDEAFYLEQTGVPALWGESGFTPAERTGARPTLEVNGLYSGFTGSGSKTVLPAWAMAKISMRLVPDQQPEEVQRQLLAYLATHVPKSVHCEVISLGGGPASISDRHSPAVQAMTQALEAAWGRSPCFRREGGSVPVVSYFQQFLGVETVNCGFSLPDDNLHGPNEKIHLPTWYRGIEALIRFFEILAR
jgi:acetylornithine deacetylase/succinyl-diaminopimelate desuccinylase-like protein